MKKSLYEISTEALEIASLLENEELTEELESRLVINQNELQNKAVNYAFVIKDSDHTINAIDDEIKRLQAMKKVEQNKQDRLKQAVSDAMNMYGIDKIETPVIKLNFRTSESVEVINFDQLSGEYKTSKTTVFADKVSIKKAIKDGKTVEGALIITNQNLQIK